MLGVDRATRLLHCAIQAYADMPRGAEALAMTPQLAANVLWWLCVPRLYGSEGM